MVIIRWFLSAWILSSNCFIRYSISLVAAASLFHSRENNFSRRKISLRDGKERKVLFPIIIETLTPLSWKIQIANLFLEIRQFPLNDLFSPSGNPFFACISQQQLAGKDNASRPVRNGIH